MILRSIAVVTLFIASACQASAGAQVQAKSSGELDANASADMDANAHVGQYQNAGGSNPTSLNEPSGYGDSATAAPDAMLGARAGLHLVKPATAKCQCLGVVVGSPTDPGFTWEGPIPKTNPATQLVLGLSSEGLPCPAAAANSLGASYRGYEIVGNDVIIQVETARLGRPIAQGAIIPMPTAGGRILMNASEPNSPYGRSPDGKSATCTVWSSP